jgi:uncharacterized protein HemY
MGAGESGRAIFGRTGSRRPIVQKTLIVIGLLIVLIGLAWPWLSALPLGRLPGDIVIERENFRLYFPLTTTIIISVVVTVILWLLRH